MVLGVVLGVVGEAWGLAWGRVHADVDLTRQLLMACGSPFLNTALP